MNTDSPQIADLFAEAIALQGQARQAFLDRILSESPSIGREIEKLLRAQPKAEGFLEQPAVMPLSETIEIHSVSEGPGTMIGPYKLLEQIGEGGFGVVYMAQQSEPVRRKIAMKIVKPGMDSKDVVARFEAERHALALMDHPNVARVLDAGATESGRPYFVMELIYGVPITDFCDQQYLTTRKRLKLFVSVCKAVQHAHQKGIIHRDLKPSNVMVTLNDDQPVVKVIDFGVAKALSRELTEKTLFTAYGQMIGTPLYMSPEQAPLSGLDVDTRSDVYSLGVLLYELLTGTTPFDKETLKHVGFDELRRMIREDEAPRPSDRISTLKAEALSTLSEKRNVDPRKLSQSLRGDLDWIVMKALAKDRGRRYETASAFAADVEHYLKDEAVVACPPSVGYRFKKFARRNKGTIAIAMIVMLFALTIAGSFGWIVRDREARQIRVAAQVGLIIEEVDQLMDNQKWPEALAGAERAKAVIESGDGDERTRQHVQHRLNDIRFILRLEQIRMQRAKVVGGTFNNVGSDREYARTFREYGVDIERLPAETSIDLLTSRRPFSGAVAAALDSWVMVSKTNSDDRDREQLLAVARGIDPDPLRDRLRRVWGKPVTPELQTELRSLVESLDVGTQSPTTLHSLGFVLWKTNQPEMTVQLLQRAQATYRSDFWLNYELAWVLNEQKDHDGAIRFLTAALAIRPKSAAAYNNLGIALQGQEKLNTAIAYYRTAIQLAPNYPPAHNNLGSALSDNGQIQDAIQSYRRAIRLDPNLAAPHNNLGSLFFKQQKWQEAEAAYREAIRIKPDYPEAQYGLGVVFYRRKQYAEAEAQFRKAIQIKPDYSAALGALGAALSEQYKYDDAIALLQKALQVDPKQILVQKGLAEALTSRGIHFYQQRSWNEAISDFTKAVEITPDATRPRQWLGWTQCRLGDWQASIESLEKSCQLQRGGTGDFGQWTALALAHWKLAELRELTPAERAWHRTQAGNFYEKSTRQIRHVWKGQPPRGSTDRAIFAFHTEAQNLILIPAQAEKPKLPPNAPGN